MGTTITVLYIELKMKISRIIYLESKTNFEWWWIKNEFLEEYNILYIINGSKND